MVQNYKENPLVTIIVVTYNSSEFVLDTLESAKKQTYNNIELIITDDSSKDDTVKICSDWLNENKKYFKNTQIVTTDKNSGIPGNCNRGIKNSNGEWIKLIAGDDILVENCLELFMDAAIKDNKIKILAGRFQTFTSENGLFNLDQRKEPKEKKLYFFDLKPAQQLQMLITETDFGFTPGVFIKKELFNEIGYFNEDFPFLEDLPYWVKLTENDVKFYLVNSTVTYYRKGHGSLLKSNTNYFSVNYMRSLWDFKHQIAYRKVPKTNFLYYQSQFVEYFHYRFIMFFFRNRKTNTSFMIGKIILLFSITRVLSKIEIFRSKLY